MHVNRVGLGRCLIACVLCVCMTVQLESCGLMFCKECYVSMLHWTWVLYTAREHCP